MTHIEWQQKRIILHDLKTNMSEEQICSLSKMKLKKYVQQQIIGYTKVYLDNIKKNHSKIKIYQAFQTDLGFFIKQLAKTKVKI